MKKETSCKLLLILLSSVFLLSILSTAVIAADTPIAVDPTQTREAGKQIGNAIVAPFLGMAEGFLQAIFGSEWAIGTRSLLFVLLFLVLWSVVPFLFGEDRTFINFSVSFIVAVLSMMSIPPELLDTLLANYGAMGATILTMIPFLIILVFSVRVRNALAARVIWLFYAGYYFSFYIWNMFNAKTEAGFTMYLLAAIVGLFLFFGIGKIRDILFGANLDALKETGNQIAKRGGLLHKLQRKELEDSYGGA